jgi:hypothetical protein
MGIIRFAECGGSLERIRNPLVHQWLLENMGERLGYLAQNLEEVSGQSSSCPSSHLSSNNGIRSQGFEDAPATASRGERAGRLRRKVGNGLTVDGFTRAAGFGPGYKKKRNRSSKPAGISPDTSAVGQSAVIGK